MGWLEQQARQSKLLQALVCGLVIAGVIGFGVYKLPYLRNVQMGPYAISPAELAAVKSVEDMPRYWVQAAFPRVLDTGVDHVTVRKRKGVETGRSVSGHFWVAQVADRLIFIESRGTTPVQGQVLTGFLVDTPQETADHLMKGVSPQWKDKVLPVMLDLGRFEGDAELGLAAGGVLIAIAVLWGAFALFKALRPRSHARLRALAAAGVPLEAAGAAIAGDIRAGQSMAVGDWRLTRDFLVKTGLRFDVRALKDLLWAYPIVVSRKLYYVIPAGKSHQLALHFPDTKLTLKIPQAVAESIMPTLQSVAPWALLGHSAELERAWKKQRKDLIAAVAERRAQVLSQPAETASQRA
ncbi:MAG: hypothetical protein NW223_07790 [Hyphomicrobiaceae bacterium]|nr:hypothetical protein [Hyphomicrobiaceae bacterium]